jgi:hypothetical protein
VDAVGSNLALEALSRNIGVVGTGRTVWTGLPSHLIGRWRTHPTWDEVEGRGAITLRRMRSIMLRV